jgi:hypothetical protein
MKTLAARINVRNNRRTGINKPRFAKLTDITIRAVVYSTTAEGKKSIAIVNVATRTIPGVWDEQTALGEFKKNPILFAFEKGYNAETFRNAA